LGFENIDRKPDSVYSNIMGRVTYRSAYKNEEGLRNEKSNEPIENDIDTKFHNRGVILVDYHILCHDGFL